jgi:hypothetical protein
MDAAAMGIIDDRNRICNRSLQGTLLALTRNESITGFWSRRLDAHLNTDQTPMHLCVLCMVAREYHTSISESLACCTSMPCQRPNERHQ